MRTKLLFLLALVLTVGSVHGALTGLWQFDGDLSAAQGSPLTFRGGASGRSTFNTTAAFGIPAINGTAAQVMKFDKYQNTDGLQVNANLAANGGGAKVNVYTMVMDLLPAGAESQFYSIFETTLANNDSDAEYFINDTDSNPLTRDFFGAGAPLGGYMRGNYVAGDWIRLALVVDCVNKTVYTYINGEFISALNGGSMGSTTAGVGGVDGRFSLTPGLTNFLMFVNPSNGFAGTGYVNSLALFDNALTPTQIKELGIPSATGIPAAFPSLPGPSSRVLTQTFNRAVGTDPVAAGDVSKAFSINGQFHGIFGWIDYDGAGDLILNHPALDYSDPWVEISTTPTLQLTDDMDAVMTFNPKFTALPPNDQSILIQLTTTTTAVDQPDAFTSADTDVFFKAKNTTNSVQVLFSNNPTNPGFGQTITTPADQITTLSVRLRYEAATRIFRAFFQVNGGTWYEYSGGPISMLRTKRTLRITAETQFGYSSYLEFQIGLNKVTLDKGINPVVAGTIGRESLFNSQPPSNGDPFFPVTYGDVDQLFVPGASGTFGYNGAGQLLFHRLPAANQFPNTTINGRYNPEESLSWKMDIKPSFQDGGFAQRFFMMFSNSPASVVVFNNTGATTVSQRAWGIQFGSANVDNPQPADMVDLSGTPISSVQTMNFLLTYNGSTQVHHLYYRINGGVWHEHPRGAVTALHGSSQLQFQYRVDSAANTLPFDIGLDNYQEIKSELPSPVPPNAATHWAMY